MVLFYYRDKTKKVINMTEEKPSERLFREMDKKSIKRKEAVRKSIRKLEKLGKKATEELTKDLQRGIFRRRQQKVYVSRTINSSGKSVTFIPVPPIKILKQRQPGEPHLHFRHSDNVLPDYHQIGKIKLGKMRL